MLSKQTIKTIRSLESKKGRDREGLFVAEGPKTVEAMLRSFEPLLIVATEEWSSGAPCPIERVRADELQRLSFLRTPQQVMAILRKPQPHRDEPLRRGSLCLALDDVQDPGNVGTILRIADWFGIDTVYVSPHTADVYGPKVVQAAMGSLAAVGVVEAGIPELIGRAPRDFPIYGTTLDGHNIYETPLTAEGLIVMGNEAGGISPEVGRLLNRRLLIPPQAGQRPTAVDSLNVAIATAITVAEFRRRRPG